MTSALRTEPARQSKPVMGLSGLLGGGATQRAESQHLARLSLSHRPGSVVLLEPEADFRGTLASAMPESWRVQEFGSTANCLNFLQQEPPRWEADYWAQQQLVAHWLEGGLLLPEILRYWATSPHRYDLTKVLLVRERMAGSSGLAVMEELIGWPGQRVLLTAGEDNGVAIDAFNAGLIHQYLRLRDTRQKTFDHVVQVVGGLLSRQDPRTHQIWVRTLSQAQTGLLRDTAIAANLQNFLQQRFVEWVCIGDPFGILCLDEPGNAYWLQLEPVEQLGALAEMSHQCGVQGDDLNRVLSGQSLTDVGLSRALGSPTKPRVVGAHAVADGSKLLAALHRLDHEQWVRNALSYRHWRGGAQTQPAGNQSVF